MQSSVSPQASGLWSLRKPWELLASSRLGEYLLMAGPYGKYLLEDCFHPTVQVVVFEYLDLLGLMWQKTISAEQLTHLEDRVPIVLTLMEILLPAWELDLNRHLMIHLVRVIRKNGPCWTWAVFGFERFWKHQVG